MSWDDDLTENQLVAARHVGNHACLLAGPGTGKTLCLTRRILYLVEECGVTPSNILALTFTRAAAAELKQRIRAELGEQSDVPHVSTLHSFALSMILSQSSGSRLPQPIRIADDFEERHIIQEELKQILGTGTIRELRDLINRLSADWEKLAADDPEWEQRFPNPEFLGTWREHRQVYGYILRSELVYQLKHAIYEQEIRLVNNIRYLLVDEYQDLNACDLAVVSRMSSSGLELYAAGDDDQSIYGFRYANPDGIRRFSQNYEASQSLGLAECMRCDRRILDLGLYVARQDPRRLEKALTCCSTAEDGEVRILTFPAESPEANGIARICRWLIGQCDVEPHEILILLRSDRHRQFSTPICAALSSLGIPAATAADPLTPLDEPEGRHFLSLLRLLVNQRDHLAWRTLLSVRNNRIGDRALSSLYDIARTNGYQFYDAILAVNANHTLVQRAGAIIAREFQNIQAIIQDVSEEELSDLRLFIERFATDEIDNEELRFEVLSIFFRILENGGIDTLEQLLRALNVSLDDNEQERERDSVNIMTMHQAKGLSADAVFIVAAEDEYLPGRATGEQVGDERRLLYVSLTRARHYLYITHCLRRTGRQRHSGRTSGRTRRTLSQFLSGGPVRPRPGSVYIHNL